MLTNFDLTGDRLEGGASGVAIQPDGKILAAGKGNLEVLGRMDFGLARYTRNGRLDPSFGARGRVVTNFGAPTAAAFAVPIQPNGKIVAAGGNGQDVHAVAPAEFAPAFDAGNDGCAVSR